MILLSHPSSVICIFDHHPSHLFIKSVAEDSFPGVLWSITNLLPDLLTIGALAYSSHLNHLTYRIHIFHLQQRSQERLFYTLLKSRSIYVYSIPLSNHILKGNWDSLVMVSSDPWCLAWILINYSFNGLPWWLSGKQSYLQCRRRRFNSWVWKISWTRKWQPTPVFLPGKSHG